MQGAEGALPAGLARRPAAAVRAMPPVQAGLRVRAAAGVDGAGEHQEEESGERVLCVHTFFYFGNRKLGDKAGS